MLHINIEIQPKCREFLLERKGGHFNVKNVFITIKSVIRLNIIAKLQDDYEKTVVLERFK